jgi:hypothetical protein
MDPVDGPWVDDGRTGVGDGAGGDPFVPDVAGGADTVVAEAAHPMSSRHASSAPAR